MSKKPSLEKKVAELERQLEKYKYEAVKYRTLFNSFPYGITITDENGAIIETNETAAQLLGLDKNEHEERRIDDPEWKIIQPDGSNISPGELPAAIALKEKKMVSNHEMGVVKPDGDISWINVTAAPIPLENSGVVITYNDITDKRQIEKDLIEKENLFRRFFENSGFYGYIISPEGIIIDVNRSALDVLQYNKDELVGMPIINIYAEESLEKTKNIFQEWKSTGQVKNAELMIRTKTGEKRWVLLNISSIKDESGSIVHSASIQMDITNRKETDFELKEALEETVLLQKETEAFLNATRVIPLCKNFKESARQIFNISRELLEAKSGYVALLSDNGKENEVLFLESGGLPCDVDPELPMPVRGLREVAYKTKNVAYDNNFSDSEWVKYMPSGHVKLDNVLFAPLNVGEKTVGVMGLANKDNGFNKRDIIRARQFGDIAALALTHCKIQENLLERDKFNNNLLEKSPNPILVINPDKSIKYVNKAFEDLTGFISAQIIGVKPPYPWWTEDTIKKTMAELTEAMKKGAIKIEEKFRKKSGEIFYVEITSTPVMHNETPEYYLANWVDITARKQRGKELLKKSKELKNHSNKLEEMNTALKVLIEHRNEEMEKLKKNFVGEFEKLVFPYFLSPGEVQTQEKLATAVSIIEQNIREILFPGGKQNMLSFTNLTPMEARVASMIKSDKTSKEIAESLNVSVRSVYFHRENIRKKFNLSQTKTNLRKYLQSKNI